MWLVWCNLEGAKHWGTFDVEDRTFPYGPHVLSK